jgi:hypothetical protein
VTVAAANLGIRVGQGEGAGDCQEDEELLHDGGMETSHSDGLS